MKRTSDIGDLTKMMDEIVAVVERHTGTKGPGVGVAITLSPHFKDCHWATNLSRSDGKRLFMETSLKMLARTN